MAEFEELRLTVTLIDNASQGLVALRQNLQALGTADQLGNLQKMQREVDELSKKMGGLHEKTEKLSSSMKFVANVVTGAVTAIGAAIVANFGLDAIQKFTDQMVRLGGLSNQLGASAGQIKNVVDQMKGLGIEEGAATAAVTKFSTALQEMMRMGSTIQQQLMGMAKSNPEGMRAWITRMIGTKGDLTAAVNELVEGLNDVFANELARTGDKMQASDLRNRVIEAFGLDASTWNMIKGRMQGLTAAEDEEIKKRIKLAQEWAAEVAKSRRVMDDIVSGIQTGLVDALKQMNTELGETNENWGKAFGKEVAKDIMVIVEALKLAASVIRLIREGFRSAAELNAVRPTPENVPAITDPKERERERLRLENAERWRQRLGGRGAAILDPEDRRRERERLEEEQRETRRRLGLDFDEPATGRSAAEIEAARKRRNIFTPPTANPISYQPGNSAFSHGTGAMGEFSRAVKIGVFDALVDFQTFMRTGSTGGGGSGGAAAVRASLTTGDNIQIPGGGTIPGGINVPGGGGGGAPYGSSVGAGTGAGAGETPAGRDGARGAGGGGAGTRADRNNNPGNIKFGQFAKAQGATGADSSGFAVFPDREAGFKAAETLLGGKGYAGKTLGQIGSRWAEGDPNWAKNVSKATGIPLDAVPTPEQRSQIARQGTVAAEGSKVGGGRAPGGAPSAGSGDQPVPDSIISRARSVATLGPAALSNWMRDQGYPQHDQWCGDFAASVVKSAGGTPPKGWAMASNWRNVGPEVSAKEAQPGDIAVARPGWSRRGSGQTGSTGSHVTVLNSIDQESGRFGGLGGNQGSGRIANFNTRQFQFYRPNVDRGVLDGAMGREVNSRVTGTGKLSVDVRAPRGTKVDAEGKGLFSKVEMNRSTQMEPARSGPSSGDDEVISL